jgi:serine protease Do
MDTHRTTPDIRKLLLILSVAVLGLVSLLGGAVGDRVFGFRPLDKYFPRNDSGQVVTEKQIVNEENVVINAVKQASPAVVTISINTPKQRVLQFDPFNGFGMQEQGGQQDIATGFIVSSDGLIVTNKHVVADSSFSYQAIDKDGKAYDVKKIYRDPANDIALLKIDATNLPTVTLGDSGNLQVGQTVIAIGTPLGEFRQSVTIGVISGLGRGIDAGSPLEGVAERLDNIIQTDAAINPGNSGGPLLDSSARVIGVDVAVAQGAQNIGFAIPINVVKDSINQFKSTGEFSRPFLGVEYQMVTANAAIANEIPQGAYVQNVVAGSSADRAGIKNNDIITKFSGDKVTESNGGLASLVNKHKVGDTVQVEVWRNGKTENLNVTLTENSQ